MTAITARMPAAPRDFFGRHQSLSITVGMAIVTAILPLIALLPPFNLFQNQSTWINSFAQAGVYVLLAVGLNIVVGLAGLLDLGYAAFYAIGAYTYAYAASPFTGLAVPFWPMLIVGAVVAATFGVLLGAPTLRLRGDYLAIVTLGFGEIVPIVFRTADRYTAGVNGIQGVAKPSLPGLGSFPILDPIPFYLTMAGLVTIVLILCYRLQESRLGRSWMAIREDELAAASNGINTVTSKLLAFALGASTAGIAGVFNASKLSIVSPDQFLFQVSFTVLAMVVLGGMGNIWGVALGAFVIFQITSVFLKLLNTFVQQAGIGFLQGINFTEYQFLLYGLALVGMMLWRPEGLFPSQRRKRELRDAMETPDTEAGALGEPPA